MVTFFFFLHTTLWVKMMAWSLGHTIL